MSWPNREPPLSMEQYQRKLRWQRSVDRWISLIALAVGLIAVVVMVAWSHFR